MDTPQRLSEDVESWETMMFLYHSAIKEVGTKLEILNDEFQHVHQYNPIEYIKSRVKTPESICKKLKRYGKEVSIENMVNYVNDIAGIRIVCSFTSDIYRVADMIGRQNDLTVVSVKDYIRHPKESGYKSYHMLVTVPVFLSDRVVNTRTEIQIRTMAMDFWASLEHKIYYKFEGNAPEYISRDLRECSDIVSQLDAKMLSLINRIGNDRMESFSTGDFLTINALYHEWELTENLKPFLKHLLDVGIVERIGRDKYVLARSLYAAAGKPGVHTRIVGLDRGTNKELLLNHIRKSGNVGTPISELQQVLPGLSRDQIRVLLRELREEHRIFCSGKTRNARWLDVDYLKSQG